MSKENNENYELELTKRKELLVVEDIELLKDRTIKAIVTDHEEFIIFVLGDNEVVMMNHGQNCCENVSIENINGDLNHLLDTPLLRAEVKSTGNTETSCGDEQYTFYTLATISGYVDLRWYGESNGCYSIEVDVDNISVDRLQKFLQQEFRNRKNFNESVKIYTNQNKPAIKFETKMLGE